MANANKASKMTTEQTDAATAVALTYEELHAMFIAGEIEPDSKEFDLYFELDKKKKIEELYLLKNKSKEILAIKEKIAKMKLEPEDLFEKEYLKSLYSTILKKEPKETAGKRKLQPAIYSIWPEVGPKARAFSIGSSDKKAEALTVFEFVDTWEELENFKVNTPEINEYLATEKGQTEIAKGKALFAEFKKLKPTKAQGIFFKTFDERKAAKA